MYKPLVILLEFSLLAIMINLPVSHAADEPAYAKWGRLAMIETKARYPEAEIIDYLHVGRESGADISTEIFKLWLKDQQKEFGVFVHISFDNQTEEIVEMTFTVTDR